MRRLMDHVSGGFCLFPDPGPYWDEYPFRHSLIALLFSRALASVRLISEFLLKGTLQSVCMPVYNLLYLPCLCAISLRCFSLS